MSIVTEYAALIRGMSLLCTDIIFVEVNLGKHTALYWFHKLHKRPHKSRFIANSSSRSTFFLRLVPLS